MRSSFVAIILRGIGAVSLFLLNLISARILGAEQAGYFLFALNIGIVIAALCRCGFDNIVLRQVSVAKSQSSSLAIKYILSRAMLCGLLAAFALGLAVELFVNEIAFYIFKKEEIGPVLMVVPLLVLGLVLLNLVSLALQGMRNIIGSIFVLNILVNVLAVLGFMLLGVTDAQEAMLVYLVALIFGVVAGFCLFYFKVRQVPAGLPNDLSWRTLRGMAVPLWMVIAVSQVVNYFGQFIVGVIGTPTEIAQFAVAQRLSMLVSLVLMSVNHVVAPNYASLYSVGDFEALHKLARKSIYLMLLISTPVLLFMLIFPVELLKLFGSEFVGGAILLQVMACGQFVNAATGSVGVLLTMSGYEKDLLKIRLVSGPLAIVMGIFLANVYGVVGAAIATAFAVGVQNLVSAYYVRIRLGFNVLW